MPRAGDGVGQGRSPANTLEGDSAGSKAGALPPLLPGVEHLLKLMLAKHVLNFVAHQECHGREAVALGSNRVADV